MLEMDPLAQQGQAAKSQQIPKQNVAQKKPVSDRRAG
jgi:hypothetical protein